MTTTPVAASLDPDRLAPDAGNPAVADVMRDEVVFCLPSTAVDAVAKLMADNELSEIPVLLDRRPVGYVHQDDILDRLVAGAVVIAGSDVATRPPTTVVQARDVLRTPPLLVDERQQVREVAAVMADQGRQVALVMHEDETPVGMLTARELADHLLAHPEVTGA
ncbi:MAG: CBS domain-containing protein [Candidatus Dormibacteraeota bacterium]|nr:CBS domain-containing protein [Candidatus Dormibacteraeota bacterium]